MNRQSCFASNRTTHLLAAICIALLAALCMAMTVPATAHAASKKTVHVIESITVHGKSGGVVDTYKYKYNKHGLVKKKTFSTYGSPTYYSYTYNKDKQVAKVVTKEYDKSTSAIEQFSYKNGVLVKRKYKWYDLKTTGKDVYTFNEKGQLKTCESVNDDGSNHWTYTYKYYSNGLLKSEKGGLTDNKYKYDKKGKLVKEYWDGKLERKYTNTYVSKSSRLLKKVTYRYKSGKKFGYHVYKYKKMKVSKADAKLVKKQQVQSCQDPVFELFW